MLGFSDGGVGTTAGYPKKAAQNSPEPARCSKGGYPRGTKATAPGVMRFDRDNPDVGGRVSFFFKLRQVGSSSFNLEACTPGGETRPGGVILMFQSGSNRPAAVQGVAGNLGLYTNSQGKIALRE